MMAVNGVHREPVSSCNSLVSGKITGKYRFSPERLTFVPIKSLSGLGLVALSQYVDRKRNRELAVDYQWNNRPAFRKIRGCGNTRESGFDDQELSLNSTRFNAMAICASSVGFRPLARMTAQRGSDYFRLLAAKRKTNGGGRPRKETE
jgi:hypothetical protein